MFHPGTSGQPRISAFYKWGQPLFLEGACSPFQMLPVGISYLTGLASAPPVLSHGAHVEGSIRSKTSGFLLPKLIAGARSRGEVGKEEGKAILFLRTKKINITRQTHF